MGKRKKELEGGPGLKSYIEELRPGNSDFMAPTIKNQTNYGKQPKRLRLKAS